MIRRYSDAMNFMMKHKQSFMIGGLMIVIGLAGAHYLYKQQQYQKESVPVAVEIGKLAQQQSATQLAGGSTESADLAPHLPSELNLKMTFYPQAPFGNWDFPWQEACEEASILLIANTYYDHQWTREQFNDQILQLVEWENKSFGNYRDTTVQQVSQMLQDYLHLKNVIHKNPNFDDLQKILARGHLVVMVFAGRELGNPFYTNGGPLYHAMVLKGYKTGEKVITEDVGTRRGEDYVYDWKTLYKATHDFTEPIDDGGKFMIEVLPPN